ncbi:MAG: IS3 family transposase [Gammaproteobacteria bacterium]|nr:IS3 family transposase [Gammaproteobacteria bacterium]
MCRILGIHRSGFYNWLAQPLCQRAVEDLRLLTLIQKSWMESGQVYGYRPITCDLKAAGEICGKNRVLRIMRAHNVCALRGYKRHPGFQCGKVHHLAENRLSRQFTVGQPDVTWVTDFTYVNRPGFTGGSLV